MKKCSRCKIQKPLSSFYSDKNRKDGVGPQCRACRKIHRKPVKQRNCKCCKKNKIITNYEEGSMFCIECAELIEDANKDELVCQIIEIKNQIRGYCREYPACQSPDLVDLSFEWKNKLLDLEKDKLAKLQAVYDAQKVV